MREMTARAGFQTARPVSESVRTKLLENLQELTSALTEVAAPRQGPDAGEIEDLLRARARRAKHFNSDLFADPAWDMLLELYAAELGQRRVSVTSLGLASGVPPTTALRWLTTLVSEGLVQRQNDPLDGRRIYISLTDAGISAMTAYFKDPPSALRVL